MVFELTSFAQQTRNCQLYDEEYEWQNGCRPKSGKRACTPRPSGDMGQNITFNGQTEHGVFELGYRSHVIFIKTTVQPGSD
jgi:hypothetical protein